MPDSKAIVVSYRAKHPQEAVDVLDALLEAHAEYYYQDIDERASGTLLFLKEEFDNSAERLKAAEDALFSFKMSDRLRGNELLDNTKGNPSFVGIVDSIKVQDEMKVYVLALEDELRKAQQIVDNSKRRRTIREIKERMGDYLDAINAIPQKELELVRLKREFDVADENYKLLERNLIRAKMVAVGRTEHMNLVTVFEHPIANESPIFPKKRLVLILALMMGVMMALTWAFVMDYFDHRLKSAQEIQYFLKMRVIASIPKIES